MHRELFGAIDIEISVPSLVGDGRLAPYRSLPTSPCRRDPRDQAAREAIQRALPSVGYLSTKARIRAAASPIDRVLARSESKVRAVTEIVRMEASELGSQLRPLVLCEFESAGGVPRRRPVRRHHPDPHPLAVDEVPGHRRAVR